MTKSDIKDRIAFVLCFFGGYVIIYVIMNMVSLSSWNVAIAFCTIPCRAYFIGGFVAIAMGLTDVGKLFTDWRKFMHMKKLKQKK